MTKPLATITVAAIGLILTGCATTEQPPAANAQMQYKLPTLTPVEPDKQMQEKDGIRISVAATTYTTEQNTRKEFRLRSTTAILGDVLAEMRETTSVAVNPSDVHLTVKINNQLERVLRLAGTVVSFQAAGKASVVPKGKYDDFLAGIILPRQEQSYEVAGPELAQVPDHTTIAFFLYDIVTATDAAGNPTKRSNFEFYYTLSREDKTLEVPSPTPKKVYVSVPIANLIQRRMGSSPDGWVAITDHELAVANAAGSTTPLNQPVPKKVHYK